MKENQELYKCPICGWTMPQDTQHYVDHCPNCLHSIHLDQKPGDRSASCHGRMEPIGVWVRKNGEWALIHRCTVCGKISSNRIAADDNPMKLMSLAMRTFASSVISQEDIHSMTLYMEDRA